MSSLRLWGSYQSDRIDLPLFRSSLPFVAAETWIGGRRLEGGEIPLHHLSSKRGLVTCCSDLVEPIFSSPGLLLFAGGIQGEGGSGREDLHLSVQWGGVHQEKVCASHTVETVDCSSSSPWKNIQRYNHRNFCIHMATSHGFDSVAQIMARWECLMIKCECVRDVLVLCHVGLVSKRLIATRLLICISHSGTPTPEWSRCYKICSRSILWWKMLLQQNNNFLMKTKMEIK